MHCQPRQCGNKSGRGSVQHTSVFFQTRLAARFQMLQPMINKFVSLVSFPDWQEWFGILTSLRTECQIPFNNQQCLNLQTHPFALQHNSYERLLKGLEGQRVRGSTKVRGQRVRGPLIGAPQRVEVES